MPCCEKRCCRECVYNVMLYCDCNAPTFVFKCPFCRGRGKVEHRVVLDAMRRFCPSHAKVMDNTCDGTRFVVAHLPCSIGCYDCVESTLVIRKL
jgi:hypothetical protein